MCGEYLFVFKCLNLFIKGIGIETSCPTSIYWRSGVICVSVIHTQKYIRTRARFDFNLVGSTSLKILL